MSYLTCRDYLLVNFECFVVCYLLERHSDITCSPILDLSILGASFASQEKNCQIGPCTNIVM